ncbi:GntR family transcriptional regulator [Paracoccus aerius]|uniref:GntR family transcriptional regulator n=1 Tax=Paracoccus aerius TaxID=1915382 RepID=A0ABS1S918_9RHOB|nr:GntR family transcriptional regulator [Paracoccus aerius]MBL3675231.1 GntR family transcriptional regulator [Paracoccus aerius]GHG31450.1 DNA-binding protein [Paracoccus aerius]
MVRGGESDGWSRLGPLTLKEGETAQSQIYARLRDALISGYFRPGEELSLRRASAALGTSVTPIREALRQLESDGGLEVFGGNRVLRVPVLSEAELIEIREIRVKLESFAAAQAINGIGPSQLRLISNACSVMQRAADTDDADLYLESNWRFHSLIYRAAERPVLMGLIEQMWLRVGPLIRLAVTAPNHFDRSMESHRAAERALRERDGAALEAAIVRDISDAASDLGKTLGSFVRVKNFNRT